MICLAFNRHIEFIDSNAFTLSKCMTPHRLVKIEYFKALFEFE